MPISDIPFNYKTISSLPPPVGTVQEYRDRSIPYLRVLRYKHKTTFLFKTCHHYQEIRETLGHFPILSISDAKKIAFNLLQQVAENKYVFNRSITLGYIVEHLYLQDMQLNKRNTQSEYSKLQRYVLAKFASCKLTEISRQSLSAYFLELRGRLAASTVNRIISIFNSIFRLAIEHGYIHHSPLEFIRYFPENNYRHNRLNVEQIDRFARECLLDGSLGAISLYLAVKTGMRISEVIQLKWSSINLEEQYIFLGKTKNNSAHIVPLTDTVITVINNRLQSMSSTDFLFPSQRTKTGHIASPRHTFKRLMQKMELQGFCIHDLRRSYASRLLDKTNDLSLVSQLLNHRSLATTQRYAFYNVTQIKNKINFDDF